MRKFLYGVVGAALLAAAPTQVHAQSDSFNLTLAGASPGGLWSTIGAGLDKALNNSYPGSTVTYQTGSGGLANSKLVADGKVPMGLASDPELNAAYGGSGPFAGNPQKDLRVLFRAYSPKSRFQYSYILINGDVAKQHNIKTMEDVKKQAGNLRAVFNRPGNMDGDVGIALIEESGISLDSFQQVVRAASREMTSLMLDRRVDLANLGIAYNHPRIRELANGLPLVQIAVDEAVAAKVATDYAGQPCSIKADEHDWISEDKLAVCVGAVIVANKSMPDDEAYKIVKGLLENLEDFKSAHRLLQKAVTPQSVAEPSAAPHHPGAIKAFKEAGLL